MTIAQYQKSIDEPWFTSSSAFICKAMQSPVQFPAHFPASATSRAVLIALRYGLVRIPPSCGACPATPRLTAHARADCGGALK